MTPTIGAVLWIGGIVLLTLIYRSGYLFAGAALLVGAYVLIGRFYHDAHLRRRIRYELSEHGLAIWIAGRDSPECVFDLFSLRDVRPQFVTKSGRGTIELPPGGWSAQPAWNRWDRDVPAMYPCRRLELIEDVEAVAELLRREVRNRRIACLHTDRTDRRSGCPCSQACH